LNAEKVLLLIKQTLVDAEEKRGAGIQAGP